MTLYGKIGRVLGLLMVLGVLTPPFAGGKETDNIAVLVSGKQKPFVEALEGLNQGLTESGPKDVEFGVFFLDKYSHTAWGALQDEIAENEYRLLIAIGPRAARFVDTHLKRYPASGIFTVVLNPEAVIDLSGWSCGVPLNLPVRVQVGEIAHAFEKKKRLGLLFDPRYNSRFFERATGFAKKMYDMNIVPLKVTSKGEIPDVLRENYKNIDALWLIPDRTVISETLVQYIIRESLTYRIPVIGYNRFFYESGAAFTFIFEYEELGRQTAYAAIDFLSEKKCATFAPVHHIWINEKILEKLSVPE